jgi:hypothetical protein
MTWTPWLQSKLRNREKSGKKQVDEEEMKKLHNHLNFFSSLEF